MTNREHDPIVDYLEMWRDELTAHDGDRKDFERAIAIVEQQSRVIEVVRDGTYWHDDIMKELAKLDALRAQI